MTNAATYKHNLARAVACRNRSVDLAFDLDAALWPWLKLAPAHPVLVEKYQYFGVMTASWALDLFAPETFTALTQFSWQCLPAIFQGRYPSHGRCEHGPEEAAPAFSLVLTNADNQPMVTTQGAGFLFQDRDYRHWRARSRQQALENGSPAAIEAAACESVGLASGDRSFIGNASETPHTVVANVPTQAGFVPAHPFHTGSGDHVNAAQLLDCGLQAAHWFVGGGKPWREPMVCIGGSAQFMRYVELDIPFSITTEAPLSSDELILHYAQAGRENAIVRLKFREPAGLT